MEVSKLTNGLLVSLLLSASVVVADSKYPAADFQPKVLYQDSEYKSSGASSSSSEVNTADSRYPAANFKPEVLFEDKSYKHKKDSISESSSSSASVSNDNVVEQNNVEATDGSSLSVFLGLLAVGIVGFILYKKGNVTSEPAKRKASSQASVSSNGNVEGLSGVAKYLESKAGPLISGVAKYLEERESVPVSSVTKYVAKQKVTARLAEAENVSGVEKYLKDRS